MTRKLFLMLSSFFLIVLLASGVVGQERPGEELNTFIRGNERFGRMLLEQAHSNAPDRNVVLSPISLSIILAALQENTTDIKTCEEIAPVFGWSASANLKTPARMLLAAFEELGPLPAEPNMHQTGPPSLPPPDPEGAWISNILVYRGKDTLTSRFVESARKDFGISLSSTGDA